MDGQLVPDTKKSSADLVKSGNGTQPSEPAVVCPFSMTLAEEFSKQCGGRGLMVEVDAEVLVSLLILYIQLRGETFSRDAVWLANHAAQSRAESLGIDPEAMEYVFRFIEKHGGQIARSNPISSMF